MKIIWYLLLTFFVQVTFAENSKITNIDFTNEGKKAKVTVTLNEKLDGFPELTVKDNVVQVAIPGSYVWPKIEKQFSYKRAFDSKLMAYQFEKDKVRVRAIVPDVVTNPEAVSLTLKGNEIVISMPAGSFEPSAMKVSRSPALAPKSKKALESKDPSIYNESYLEKILKESEEKQVEVNKDGLEAIAAKAKREPGQKTDTVTLNQSAVAKKTPEEKESFSMMGYVGKFAGFLALILLIFYGVVSLMKKGAFSKSKLGFLNSTKVVEVLNTTYIAPKRSMLLIRAHNQVFLVGSSEGGFEMISEIRDPSGLMKEGEKQISGTNFDTTLSSANQGNKEFKLKEFLNQSTALENTDLDGEEESIALKAIENEMKAAKQSHKVKFSDQIKNKIKDLKPLQ